MKSQKTKKDLMTELNRVFQRQGTLTVLHTNAVAQHIGLSATEFECLDTIRNNQPITAGQLAVFCGLTTGAITGLIDRLERAGYVRRAVSPTDRRVVLIEPVPNPKIGAKVRSLYEPMGQAFAMFAGQYSDEQLEFLIAAQTALCDVVQAEIERMNSKKRI